jgi:hypothetical protein
LSLSSKSPVPQMPTARATRTTPRRRTGIEKLAHGVQKLSDDDLLYVVILVYDNETSETYTKNDVEDGGFHIDLYTLPDSLVNMLRTSPQERLIPYGFAGRLVLQQQRVQTDSPEGRHQQDGPRGPLRRQVGEEDRHREEAKQRNKAHEQLQVGCPP